MRQPMILLVDDKKDMLESLSLFLRAKFSWHIQVFDDPGDALDFIREKHEQLDLIVSDYWMPGKLDGISFLEKARVLAPDALQILITAYAKKEQTIEAINRLDLYFFLEKPFDTEHLTLILRNAIERRKLSRSLAQERLVLEQTCLQLKHTEENLIDKSKQALIGELIQGVCHNLNTPLGLILGYSELLEMRLRPVDREALPVDWAQPLHVIRGAGERIQQIVENLMSKSRMEQQSHRQSLSLNQLVSQELEFLQAEPFLHHEVEVQLELAEQLPLLWLNYGELSQILINLIRNALDAMTDNERQPKLLLRTFLEGSDLCLEVHDSGHGVPVAIQDRIFEPFFTTKQECFWQDTPTPLIAGGEEGEPNMTTVASPNAFEKTRGRRGSGIGLANVKTMLRPYHGRIQLRSSVFDGACFCISLPISPNLPPTASSSINTASPTT